MLGFGLIIIWYLHSQNETMKIQISQKDRELRGYWHEIWGLKQKLRDAQGPQPRPLIPEGLKAATKMFIKHAMKVNKSQLKLGRFRIPLIGEIDALPDDFEISLYCSVAEEIVTIIYPGSENKKIHPE